MSLNELLNFPKDAETELICETADDNVRFTICNLTTSWMDSNDPFIKRIQFENLNHALLDEHLSKEIEIRNVLDEGIGHLNRKMYPKAIKCFDEVICYDSCYAQALINKAYALEGQGHFVKSLRHYKKAVKCDGSLKDIEYYKALLKKANDERSDFPKIKSNIYAGDEHFAHGEYEKAVESYDKALNDPSGFKDKILSRLLNKKATALIELEDYGGALECFDESLKVGATDYACFGRGFCEHNLNLNVFEEFRKPLKITKKQSLEQAVILNELGFYGEALKICDYLMENHFKCDDFYSKLLDTRKVAVGALQ
jgi:tetratricopeptide (TPR) repeat protein